MRNISGKSYSLFSNNNTTDKYFTVIRRLTDQILQQYPDEEELLLHLQKASNNRGVVKKLCGKQANNEFHSSIRSKLISSLDKYTTGVKDHLKSLSLFKKFDPIQNTTEDQYHLYMLEIELINRIYNNAFKTSENKVSFIAHCLRDYHERCLSALGDIDYVCNGCTKDCYINLGSKILEKYHIKPFISVIMDQAKLFKNLKNEYQSIGMLGIACIPELVRGMRLCISLDIPPVGIPLSANNCGRWRGHAHETSFNIKELENLVK